jgi:hypothetical protein
LRQFDVVHVHGNAVERRAADVNVFGHGVVRVGVGGASRRHDICERALQLELAMRAVWSVIVGAALIGCIDLFPSDPNAVVSCNAFTRTVADAPKCNFVVTGCADANQYTIVCGTETDCTCILTPAEGAPEEKTFTAESACSAIDTDDVVQVDTFFNTNCGWNITSNTF